MTFILYGYTRFILILNFLVKKLLLILLFLSFKSLIYADTGMLFLEGIKDVVKLDYSDGSMYEGQVEKCLIGGKEITCFRGVGIYTFKTGYRYEGEFEDNKPNGQGVFTSPDGQRYQGGFRDGKLNGIGVMNYPDGRHYEGEYKNNKRDGYGIMIYQDGSLYQEGSHYEGEWKNDKRDGQGVMTYLDDGRRLEGEFKEDAFIGN